MQPTLWLSEVIREKAFSGFIFFFISPVDDISLFPFHLTEWKKKTTCGGQVRRGKAEEVARGERTTSLGEVQEQERLTAKQHGQHKDP